MRGVAPNRSQQQHATVRVSPLAMKTYLWAVVCCRRCAGRLCPGRRAVRAVEPRVASTTALRRVQTVGGTKLSRRARIGPSRCAVPPGFTHRCIEVQAQRCQPGIEPVSPTYNQMSTRASQRWRGRARKGEATTHPLGVAIATADPSGQYPVADQQPCVMTDSTPVPAGHANPAHKRPTTCICSDGAAR
jgi:hypothetical protein